MSFTHNSEVAKNEPDWGGVDKTKLPRIAFADKGQDGEKSTWGYPHHFVENGGSPDDNGCYTTGTLYLHRDGLNAAWSAANGGHTGKKASAEVIAHLEAHRKALGLDKQQAEPPKQFTIPASACRLLADISIGDNGADAKTAPIKIMARSGNPVEVPGLDAPLLHDFAGMQVKPRVAIDWSHDGNKPLGYCNKFDTDTGELVASGALTSVDPADEAAKTMARHRAGIPMEASIDWRGKASIQCLEEGESDIVNGKTVQGPMYVARQWPLRGIALCLHGVDGNTYAQFSAGDTVELTVMPHKSDMSGQTSSGGQTMSEQSTTASDTPVETATPEKAAAEGANGAVETIEGAKGEEKPVETQAVEGDKPVETPKQTEVQTEANTKTLSEGERFLKTFGDSLGGKWYAQGKTLEEATQLFVQHLSQENAELKAQLQATRGAASPVSFSESTTSDAQRELSEAAKQMTAKGVSPAVAQLAAAMQLHRKKAK